MSSAVIQLLVLAGIALFLILRLRNVLGTRDGFEKPPLSAPGNTAEKKRREFEVIEGGSEGDADILEHTKEGSKAAKALAAMKAVDPSLSVHEFLDGARGAYEMILMAFEKGDISAVRPFLSDEVAESLSEVITAREKEGLTIEAQFVGLRDMNISSASFDKKSGEGEISVRFVGELTSVVRNAKGDIVEGNPTEIKRQKDVWTFARIMGASDPNWQLVATGG